MNYPSFVTAVTTTKRKVLLRGTYPGLPRFQALPGNAILEALPSLHIHPRAQSVNIPFALDSSGGLGIASLLAHRHTLCTPDYCARTLTFVEIFPLSKVLRDDRAMQWHDNATQWHNDPLQCYGDVLQWHDNPLQWHDKARQWHSDPLQWRFISSLSIKR